MLLTDRSVFLHRFGGYVAFILVGSLAVTAAAAVKCGDDSNPATTCNGPTSYAIAAGAGSLAFAIVYCVLQKIGSAGEGVTRFFAHFFVLWWAPAVVVLTFFEPFNVTGASGKKCCWGFFAPCFVCHAHL